MKWFNLFPTSIIVEGYKKTLLLSLAQNQFIELPIPLKELILSLNRYSIDEVSKKYSLKRRDIIDFIEQLCELKIGCISLHKIKFKKLNLIPESPYNFNVLVFLINSTTTKNVFTGKTIDCLTFYVTINLKSDDLKSIILSVTNTLNINSIQIRFMTSINDDYIKEIIDIHVKLTHIILENNTEDKILFKGGKTILFLNKYIISNKLRFVVNLPYYLESLNYNSYVYKRLIIDSSGKIRFHIEEPQKKFNLKDFDNAKNLSSYLNLVKAKKDDTDICKHCEFRYICVDSRLPIQRNEREWYFETECNYNPYIAKWQNEDGYKTLSECGIQSDKNSFKINRKKLNAIHKEIWGDD